MRMQRLRIKENIPAVKDINEVVRDGILSTQAALFNFCGIAANRINKLSKVSEIIEEKLLSKETLDQIRSMPWQSQMPIYDALNKMVGDMTGFLHKMHLLASDSARTECLKKALTDIAAHIEEKESEKNFDLTDLDPDNVSKVVNMLQYEMKRRTRKSG